jgi:hypothetical protein
MVSSWIDRDESGRGRAKELDSATAGAVTYIEAKSGRMTAPAKTPALTP